jgi:hypothetical protein
MQFAKKVKSKRVCFDTNVAVEKSLLSKATKIIRKRKLHFGEKDDPDNRAMDAHEDYQVNVFNHRRIGRGGMWGHVPPPPHPDFYGRANITAKFGQNIKISETF